MNNSPLEKCPLILYHLRQYLGEDKATWGLVGLLHDLDYSKTSDKPEKHTFITETWLEELNAGLTEEMMHAIRAHPGHIPCESKMDWALYCSDPVTGLIVAGVLMHPDKKLEAVTSDFMLRRFKEKRFAAGADREAITSCEKMNDRVIGVLEGTYIGSFSTSTSLNPSLIDGSGENYGIAEVTIMDDQLIQVHCNGSEIDTTFLLNYYEHNDRVLVCLTGDAFENLYGHMLGDGHMGGGMMGDLTSGETQWMHHRHDEHEEGDEHYGGFNMPDETFTYSFRMIDHSIPYYLNFHGTKD